MTTINDITNLSTYSILNELRNSLISKKNMYVILSQISDPNILSDSILLSDLKNENIFGINISGDNQSDLVDVLYESDETNYTHKYLDSDSSVIRYLKSVEDPNELADNTMFWLYVKKGIKWGIIPSTYKIYNSHKSQHLCILDNFISGYINNSDVSDVDGFVISSVYNDETNKSYNNSNDNEYALFEYFIKVQNKFSCSGV